MIALSISIIFVGLALILTCFGLLVGMKCLEFLRGRVLILELEQLRQTEKIRNLLLRMSLVDQCVKEI